MEKYTLTKPIEQDGVEITVLSLDLEGLSSTDLEKCERLARMMLSKKETMHVAETNKKYLSCVAAKAAGVKLDTIKALNAKDYTQVCLLVQNFLLDGDSDSMEDLEAELVRVTESSEITSSTTKKKTFSTESPVESTN